MLDHLILLLEEGAKLGMRPLLVLAHAAQKAVLPQRSSSRGPGRREINKQE
jgi:hypothetical protein